MSAALLARIAVVVPIGPGETAWRGLLPQLAALPDPEVHLVACATADMAPAQTADGLHWQLAPRGRARQLNAGARATRREFLWFLHADSRLAPPGGDPGRTLAALATALAARPDALGYFDLRFADGPRWMALNAFGAWLRSRWLGLPFGDQGLFLARAVFERLGGYDESLPMAEDHALIWSARRAGVALAPARAPLWTSARRYSECGWLATTWRFQRLTWHQARRFAARAAQRQ